MRTSMRTSQTGEWTSTGTPWRPCFFRRKVRLPRALSVTTSTSRMASRLYTTTIDYAFSIQWLCRRWCRGRNCQPRRPYLHRQQGECTPPINSAQSVNLLTVPVGGFDGFYRSEAVKITVPFTRNASKGIVRYWSAPTAMVRLGDLPEPSPLERRCSFARSASTPRCEANDFECVDDLIGTQAAGLPAVKRANLSASGWHLCPWLIHGAKPDTHVRDTPRARRSSESRAGDWTLTDQPDDGHLFRGAAVC